MTTHSHCAWTNEGGHVMVTLRYDAEDDDELHSWEECVRLDLIGAVSTRLAYFSRTAEADDIEMTGDCPESEQLPSQG